MLRQLIGELVIILIIFNEIQIWREIINEVIINNPQMIYFVSDPAQPWVSLKNGLTLFW